MSLSQLGQISPLGPIIPFGSRSLSLDAIQGVPGSHGAPGVRGTPKSMEFLGSRIPYGPTNPMIPKSKLGSDESVGSHDLVSLNPKSNFSVRNLLGQIILSGLMKLLGLTSTTVLMRQLNQISPMGLMNQSGRIISWAGSSKPIW